MRRGSAARALAATLVLVGCGALPPAAPAQTGEERLRLACHRIAVPGAEDVAIHAEAGVVYLSSTNRRALFGQRETLGREGDVGHLVRLDLKRERPEPEWVTPAALRDHVFQPHGLGLLPLEGGRARLFVVNHRAPLRAGPAAPGKLHTVEILDLPSDGSGPVGVHRLGITGPPLTNPNDVAPVGGDAFYVTNTDDGESEPVSFTRAVLGLGGGSLAYFDGSRFHEQSGRIASANGVIADRWRGLLHVSSSADGMLRSYSWREGHPARLVGHRATGFRADNIEFAPSPKEALLVAGHPSVWALFRHRFFGREDAPSRVARLPLGEDGLPQGEVVTVYDSDGVETRDDAIAAASVMAAWTSSDKKLTRYIIGAILSGRVLLCDARP